jgi:hypothetical protein
MYKIWYSLVFSEDGTVYKRFVTISPSNIPKSLLGKKDKEGKYMFLTLSQNEKLGLDQNYNTAIFIKD